jgi:hypothetical protein
LANGNEATEVPVDISLPPIVGDPAGMRMLAAALRSDATLVGAVAKETSATVEGLEFYGPAAERIDAAVRSSSKQAVTFAEQLLATAGLLERAATDVEAQQRARERELERLRRELAPHPVAP